MEFTHSNNVFITIRDCNGKAEGKNELWDVAPTD